MHATWLSIASNTRHWPLLYLICTAEHTREVMTCRISRPVCLFLLGGLSYHSVSAASF